MTEIFLSIDPHDPIIARDGRPFGLGLRMKSLDWLYPSVLAGSIRTMLGKMNGGTFDKDTVKKLKNVSVDGPLPLCNNSLYLPAPLDILVDEDNNGRRIAYPVRPCIIGENEGCNMPKKGLLPAMIPKEVGDDFKPADIAPFWSMENIINWLKSDLPDDFETPRPSKIKDSNGKERRVDPASGYMALPEKESRTHVKIDPKTGTSDEGKLFETIGLDFGLKNIKIAARVDTKDFTWNDSFHPLGGERRLVFWEKTDQNPGWSCPEEIIEALNDKSYIRMVLATPAVFSNGWLPGWLDKETLSGTPPGLLDSNTNIVLTLKSACIERWKPLSGWDLEKRGPKPIRRLVPAGSVYFFEVKGNPEILAQKLWLRPVSDRIPDDKNGQNYGTEGFGLALWGVWNAEN